MANITYRISSTETNPASTTVKNVPLTNLEMDANIKSLNDNKAETSGTNATGTWPIAITGVAATATKLATPRAINGTDFDGTAAISIDLDYAVTFNNSGTGAASGTTFNGGSVQTISYNTIGAAPAASPTLTGTVTLPSTTSIGTVSNTEISYLDGVTSAIQTQINNKVGQTAVTKSAVIPTGADADRDASPLTGYFRFNTTIGKFEGYDGSVWGSVGGGATGASGNSVFWENDQVVSSSYTISTTKNAGTFGPVTVLDGVTVTIPSGGIWTIV